MRKRRKLWEIKTELPFTGGPGVSGNLLMMGTENGEVLRLMHLPAPSSGQQRLPQKCLQHQQKLMGLLLCVVSTGVCSVWMQIPVSVYGFMIIVFPC